MLSLTIMAVTRAEADAYAAERGIGDWTGPDATKDAALRRGQDYIAGEYNGRWALSFNNDAAPDEVRFAIIEAATREIKVPFSLTPDFTPTREKVLTGVKGITWTPISVGGLNGFKPRLTSVEGLLSGLVSGGLGGGGFTGYLARG